MGGTLRLLLGFVLIHSSLPLGEVQPQVTTELFDAVPDCDADFSLHALAMIQSKMGNELQRLQQVEAILASCNKPMLQKLTEASIRLLHKGVIPTQLTEQLRQLSAARKKIKREKFLKLMQDAPPEYREIIRYIGEVNTNDSLSGNEKLLYIQSKLIGLKSNERIDLKRFLSDAPLSTSPVIPLKIVIPPTIAPPDFFATLAPSSPIERIEPPLPATQKPKINFSIPPSFSIGPDAESLLFSSRKLLHERPELPSRESELQPSVFIKTLPSGVKEFPTLPTRSEPEPAVMRPHFQTSLGTPISPQVLSQGKPVTLKGIEDSDLLKSRNNIWAEAAKFLDQSTNIPQAIRKFLEDHALKGNPQLLAGLNVPANTFPLPAGVYEQLSKAYSGNTQMKRFLPVREQRDAIIPEIKYKGLDRFDTQLGRFATGDPNSKQIFAQIPIEQRPALNPNPALQATTRSNPLESTTSQSILEGGYVQVPNRAAGFVQLPTYAPAPMIADLKQPTITTKRPVIKENPKEAVAMERFPNFPSLDTTMKPDPNQEFVPYRGPEEITGSRLYPKEPYNQETGGQRRFVKIDLLNEH